MRNLRPVVAALAALAAMDVFVGSSTVARADEPSPSAGRRTSSLAWARLEGAEACIATSALAQSVEARLGRKVFVSASDADITIEGTIGRAPKGAPGFRAQLRVTAKDGSVLGTRDVETRSSSCDAIDEKLSLVVSVLVDPDAAGAPPPEPPPPPPPTIIERERVIVVHDAREPPPKPREPWRFELTLALMGTVGLQPDVGVAFAPSVVLTPPGFWGIRAGGGLAASTSARAEEGATADASFAHGSLALCPFASRGGRLEALACAGAVVGALRARGIGFDTSATTSSVVAGPVVTGRVSVALLGPLVASLALELVVPIAHAEIGYRTAAGGNALFRTAPVGAMAELGLGVNLP
ncbi:MAG: hypothetical protein JST00_23690 [Deltaproteobacteria bacterium]|nr:hypothetical protein [Deltaproteobacteria bacterium]